MIGFEDEEVNRPGASVVVIQIPFQIQDNMYLPLLGYRCAEYRGKKQLSVTTGKEEFYFPAREKRILRLQTGSCVLLLLVLLLTVVSVYLTLFTTVTIFSAFSEVFMCNIIVIRWHLFMSFEVLCIASLASGPKS